MFIINSILHFLTSIAYLKLVLALNSVFGQFKTVACSRRSLEVKVACCRKVMYCMYPCISQTLGHVQRMLTEYTTYKSQIYIPESESPSLSVCELNLPVVTKKLKAQLSLALLQISLLMMTE